MSHVARLARAASIVGTLALAAPAAEPRVLCTTFPVYQVARNVTADRAGVTVALLLPASLGCPHDYALTPGDMRKLAAADVLVINGLGLEEFLGAPLKRANPAIRVVDSSAGITNTLAYADGDDGAHHEEGGRDAGHRHEAEPPGDHDHGHYHAGTNPHLFASPRQSARLALNIAAALSQVDPAGEPVYTQNATAYAARLDALADEMAAAVRTFPNRRVVQPHGAFDYLARDLGLEIVATTQPHGQEPSAAELLTLMATIRTARVGAILTEPQYSPKVAETLSRETGVPLITLDPAASGPDAAPLDHYERTMRRNLETLRAVLGPSRGSKTDPR